MKKLLAVLLALSTVTLVGCSSEPTSSSSSAVSSGSVSSSSAAPVSEDPDQPEPINKVVYEDDFVKVSFIEVYEESFISGTTYAKFELENKSNQEITVLPMDSAVNDTAVMYLSGTPATMQAGKKLNQAWFFTNENAGIQCADDISTLSFTLQVLDESFGTLAESGTITVTVK